MVKQAPGRSLVFPSLGSSGGVGVDVGKWDGMDLGAQATASVLGEQVQDRQSIPPPLLQLLASLPPRLPCNNPSAAAVAFSSERSRPLTPLSRLAYTTAEKKYTAPPIPIPPPPPSPASFCVLASPPASTSRLLRTFF
ncbi:hypothetical protein FALCPG4_001537 [Fusarium falciforme]